MARASQLSIFWHPASNEQANKFETPMLSESSCVKHASYCTLQYTTPNSRPEACRWRFIRFLGP